MIAHMEKRNLDYFLNICGFLTLACNLLSEVQDTISRFDTTKRAREMPQATRAYGQAVVG